MYKLMQIHIHKYVHKHDITVGVYNQYSIHMQQPKSSKYVYMYVDRENY